MSRRASGSAGDTAPFRSAGAAVVGARDLAKAEISLATLLLKRLQVIGSTLRALPESVKAALVEGFVGKFGAALADGRLAPVVDRVLPLSDAGEAHRVMKRSEHFGKIVLEV